MKIAHLILAHKEPQQLERLVKALAHEDAAFYIHLSKKTAIAPFLYLQSIPRVHFIQKRISVRWAAYSLMDAMIGATREILESGVAYDYINLISGQDYPIKPAATIHAFLENHFGMSFIYDADKNSYWWSHARSRIEQYHTTSFAFRGQYRLQSLINWLAPKRKFPLPLELYGGANSTWWTLTRDCAAYLIRFIESNRKLRTFAYFTWGVDELMTATILMNSPYRAQLVSDNYRYIDWTKGEAHPKILTLDDLEKLKKSDCLFARKFDIQQDTAILDAIDRELLQQKTPKKRMMA